MHLTDDDWEALRRHVTAPQGGAPKPIYLMVAALVPVQEISASWVEYRASGQESTTTWSVWAATPMLLGHVQLTFDHPFYDSSEEGERSSVTTTLNAAWARPLSSISALVLSDIGPMVAATYGQGHWYGVAGGITFVDGFQTALPQPPAPRDWEDHRRWDGFIEAIRSAIC